MSTPEEACKSQINRSPSKAMFSFPKTARFKEMPRSKSVDKFYDLPNIFSKIGTSFSKGGRNNSVKKLLIDKFYDIPMNFNKIKPEAQAFSFGISRKYYEKVYIPNAKVTDPKVPGPGHYECVKKIGEDAPKFKFYLKDKSPSEKKLQATSPGPGEYKVIETSKTGKYCISSLKNVTSMDFAKYEETRFEDKSIKKKGNLGPGTYEPLKLFNKTGFLFVGKFKSSIGKTFGRRLEYPILKQTSLGPGQYKVFSDFGYPNQNFDFSKSTVRNKTATIGRSQTSKKKKEEEVKNIS